MNFLLRSASSATHRPPVSEPPPPTPPQPPILEEAEQPFPQYPSLEDHNLYHSADGNEESNANTDGSGLEKFSDEIPDNWSESLDIQTLRSLDRSFVFPGICVSFSSVVVTKSGLGCTHLWLQSRVPLGSVPPKSTGTIKLELLPLTDGIITLDTLQVHVKERGRRYVPEQSLKIKAT